MNNYQDELIGMFLIKPELLKVTILNEMFFDNKHAIIFKKIKKDYEQHDFIIMQDLASDKSVDFDLAVKCAASCTTTVHFDHYQAYAVAQYKKRFVLTYAKKLSDDDIDTDIFFQKVNKVTTLGIRQGTRVTYEKLMNSVRYKKKKIMFTRFKKFGDKLKLKENDLMILAGATGVGKSALALNILDDLSNNYPCLYFNLEMAETEIDMRMISIHSGLKVDEVDNYINLSQARMNVVNKAIREIDERHIDVANNSITLDELRSAITTYNQDKHFIVFVDHIGLIGTRGRTSYEKMTEIAKELRKMSLDNNCTIIGLCQLSRGSNDVNRPSLKLLRDSGEIEQSASKVVFFWEEKEEEIIHHSIIIEKNRSGKKARIPVIYNKENQLINEVIVRKKNEEEKNVQK